MAEPEVIDVKEAEITEDIFADEGEQTPPKESSPKETKTEEPKEEDKEVEPPKEDEPKVEEPKVEPPKEGEEPPEVPTEDEAKPRTAEARKEQLSNEIRELVSKRNEARAEIEAINAKVYQPQTADELIEAGEDPAMARVQALEQRQQLAEFNAQVADLNATLSVESLQVLNDFPIFNPDAPEYNEALAQRAAAIYQKAAGIQTDPETKLIIQANAMPYDIYKAFAETHAASVQSGQVNGQKAAEKMLAAADTAASAAPKAAKVDPLVQLWTED